MSILIKGMEMPKSCFGCPLFDDVYTDANGDDNYSCGLGVPLDYYQASGENQKDCPLIYVPEHRRLKKRVVYRGDVFNALESARIIALDGVLTDRYKDGFHDGLKRALEILANEVQDVQILEMYMPFFIPNWIPVTEQLPPAEKEVYVTDGEYIARANLLDEVFPGDKPCWSYSGLGEITYWCEQIPLPQSPKEE